MGFLRCVCKLIADWADPVCQNPNAVLIGEYRGVLVKLAPVMSADGRHIDDWVPAPDEADRVDDLHKHLATETTAPAGAVPAGPPPALPLQPASGGFDPGGIPGL